jgi:hypothetical protein
MIETGGGSRVNPHLVESDGGDADGGDDTTDIGYEDVKENEEDRDYEDVEDGEDVKENEEDRDYEDVEDGEDEDYEDVEDGEDEDYEDNEDSDSLDGEGAGECRNQFQGSSLITSLRYWCEGE